MLVYDGCLFVLIVDCDSQVNQINNIGGFVRNVTFKPAKDHEIMVVSLSLACLCKFEFLKLFVATLLENYGS